MDRNSTGSLLIIVGVALKHGSPGECWGDARSCSIAWLELFQWPAIVFERIIQAYYGGDSEVSLVAVGTKGDEVELIEFASC